MKSFLITTPLRASPLPGSSVSLHAKHRTEVQTPRPSPPRSIWDSDSGLSKKVRKACKIARGDGYRYIWVDSSCIDKTSSAELSEAINSMFKWYRDAQICYAFLADVPSSEDIRALDPKDPGFLRKIREEGGKFQKSRWFKRSWTLQELIAPRTVVFLSKDWKGLGTKDSLADVVEAITHIDRDILTHKRALADESVAERMRWAARRQATRVEDEAYSLLGIFGITMPTLYGEGRHAFQRLQEEILQRIPDRTLFAWGEGCAILTHRDAINAEYAAGSPFASSPQYFRPSEREISSLSQGDFDSLGLQAEEYTFTPHGIRAKLSFIPLNVSSPDLFLAQGGSTNRTVDSLHFVVLGSQEVFGTRHFVGKQCSITRINGDIELLHVSGSDSFIYTVSPNELVRAHNLELRSVYLPYPTPSIANRRPTQDHPYGVGCPWTPTLSITLSPWAEDVLPPGCTIRADPPTESYSTHSPLRVILQRTHYHPFGICIQFRYMLDGQVTIIEARIWILPPRGDLDAAVQVDTLLQSSPPYTSALWSSRPRESPPPLTPKNVHLVTQSGLNVALRLWLGFGAPSRCNIHVEVATYAPSPSRELSTRAQAALEGRPRWATDTLPSHLKFTMLGSTIRALEAQGYAVHLEQHDSENSEDSHYLSLAISKGNPGSGSAFTILIKYFQTLYQDPWKRCFTVVAHVTLESVLNDSSGRFQDGPYVACWADNSNDGWHWCLARKEIGVITLTGASLRLCLGLDLAWHSEYYLVVNIEDGNDFSRTNLLVDRPRNLVTLTLPSHIKRALQADGYDVHFERQGEDRSNPYHLRLSDARVDVVIDIMFSHHLSTGSDGRSRLFLQACVAAPSLCSSRDAAARSSGQIAVDWEGHGSESRIWMGRVWEPGGWYWDPQPRDITLALPNGARLALRLGFYLVWPSEYCLTIEVNPPTLLPPARTTPVLPQTTLREGYRPSVSSTKCESASGDEGSVDIEESLAAGEVDGQAVAHSSVVASVALPLSDADPQLEGSEGSGRSTSKVDQTE